MVYLSNVTILVGIALVYTRPGGPQAGPYKSGLSPEQNMAGMEGPYEYLLVCDCQENLDADFIFISFSV